MISEKKRLNDTFKLVESLKDVFQPNPLAEQLRSDLMWNIEQEEIREKEFWNTQSKLTAEARINTYVSRLEKFLVDYVSTDQEDFLREEIEGSKVMMKRVDFRDLVQKKAYYHVKGYLENLNDKLQNIIEEKRKIENGGEIGKQIPFAISRVETIVFWILIKDSGLLGNITDYRLAELIQLNCHYDNDKSLKRTLNVISIYRYQWKDVNIHLNNIKDIINKAEIKVKNP